MSNTAWDMYQAMMKQSADALVPGQVGMGMTPGVTGMLDSDPMTASNSAIAAQRAAMQEAALLHANADAGAGYSTPAPGTSPSLQMAADVKAASVVEEAIKFAEHVYLMNKQAVAYAEGPSNAAAADVEAILKNRAFSHLGADYKFEPKGMMAQLKAAPGAWLDMAKGNRGLGRQAAAIGGPLAAVGALGYGGYQMMQPPAPEMTPPAPEMEPKAAFQLPFTNYHLVHRPSMGQRVDRAVEFMRAQAQKVNNPAGYVAMGATGLAGAAGGAYMMDPEMAAMKSAADTVAYANMLKRAAEGDAAAAAADAAKPGFIDKAKGYLNRGVNAYDTFSAAHPRMVPAGALAVGGAAGFGAAHYMAHQAQLAQQAAAAEQGLAAPQNEAMAYMKAAALNEAANAGQLMALRQLGLA